MVTEADLIVRLEEAASGEDELALTVALEAGARDDVEHPVGAVAQGGVVGAAIDFKGVDVFGVDLWGDVGGDVGVGQGDAGDQPVELVAAADVEHVVSHVGTRDEVGDHGHGIGAVRAGGLRDVDTVDEGGGGDGIDVGGCGESLDSDAGAGRCDG